MPSIHIHAHSETDVLTDVIMASVSNFRLTEPINITQESTYVQDPPRLDLQLQEEQELVRVLEQNGVRIHWAHTLPDCPFQSACRDIGVVIGDTFVLANLKKEIRENEAAGIEQILAQLSSRIVVAKKGFEGGFLEGGDVILDNDLIFVGVSQRTDVLGVEFIRQNFNPSRQIVSMRLREPFVHLDAVFNLAPPDIALIYPGAFVDPPLTLLRKRYSVVEITEEEQGILCTNVLALSPEKVISDRRNSRVNALLRDRGIQVFELEYSETTKRGGAFRCATLPLVRKKE